MEVLFFSAQTLLVVKHSLKYRREISIDFFAGKVICSTFLGMASR